MGRWVKICVCSTTICGVVVRNAAQGGCVCMRTVGGGEMALVSIGPNTSSWIVWKGCLRNESAT